MLNGQNTLYWQNTNPQHRKLEIRKGGFWFLRKFEKYYERSVPNWPTTIYFRFERNKWGKGKSKKRRKRKGSLLFISPFTSQAFLVQGPFPNEQEGLGRVFKGSWGARVKKRPFEKKVCVCAKLSGKTFLFATIAHSASPAPLRSAGSWNGSAVTFSAFFEHFLFPFPLFLFLSLVLPFARKCSGDLFYKAPPVRKSFCPCATEAALSMLIADRVYFVITLTHRRQTPK